MQQNVPLLLMHLRNTVHDMCRDTGRVTQIFRTFPEFNAPVAGDRFGIR